MTTKNFNKKADAICKKHGYKKLNDSYNIQTLWGELYLSIDPSPRIKVYSLFMRFKDTDKFNLSQFKACFSEYEVINPYSLKWNVHNSDFQYVLDLLDERLDILKWLDKKQNLNLILNQDKL